MGHISTASWFENCGFSVWAAVVTAGPEDNPSPSFLQGGGISSGESQRQRSCCCHGRIERDSLTLVLWRVGVCLPLKLLRRDGYCILRGYSTQMLHKSHVINIHCFTTKDNIALQSALPLDKYHVCSTRATLTARSMSSLRVSSY